MPRSAFEISTQRCTVNQLRHARRQLVLIRPDHGPGRLHADGAVRDAKAEAEVDGVLLPHRLAVHVVDQLDAVQAVDHADFADQPVTARCVRFDPQRRHQRPGVDDADLHRAVLLPPLQRPCPARTGNR